MAKKLLLFFSIFLIVGVVVVSFFIADKKAPEISINSTPVLSCDCEFSELINYASVKDDTNIKSFFVEERTPDAIINNKYATYVAIDDVNNVAKLQTKVDISDDYLNFHIEKKKDLRHQLGHKLQVSDYFTLKNNCGIEVDDRFKISEVNVNKVGLYDIKVESTVHKTEPLYETFEVVDENSPIITLSEDRLENYTNRYWSSDYLKEYIESISDDKDSEEYLRDKVEINWKDVMKPDSSGRVTSAGDYEISYTVTDSDNNKSTKKMIIHLENEPVTIVQQEQEGEEGND